MFTPLLIAALLTGVIIGYRVGLDNQAYYDAPAKIYLFSNLLDSGGQNGSELEDGKARNYLKGEINTQSSRINDNNLKNVELLALMPPHGNAFLESYEFYLNELEHNQHYLRSIAMLCKYGSRQYEKCQKIRKPKG